MSSAVCIRRNYFIESSSTDKWDLCSIPRGSLLQRPSRTKTWLLRVPEAG